jgi:hypothetical protein
LAAASMLHCASMPGHGPAGMQAHEATSASAHDDHGHHQGHGAIAGLDVTTDADPSLTHSTGAGHKCSSCAACCAGVGLPAAAAQLPDLDLGCEPVTLAGASPVTFISSGPERPPRADLA